MAAAQCDLTPGFDNLVTLVEGDFEITFATNGTVFPEEGAVQMELIIRNIGSGPAEVNWPVTPPEGFFVTPLDCTAVKDCLEDVYYHYPPALMYVPGSFSLEAGECRKYTTTWDLMAHPVAIGSYRIWGGIMAWTTDVAVDPLGEWILPAAGASLTVEVDSAVGTAVPSLNGFKALYR